MTTALDAIKAVYPAQYYGIPDTVGAVLSDVIDVWNAQSVYGNIVDILTLPAASSLTSLTAGEATLAGIASITGYRNIPVENLILQYPGRFYCDKNSPCAVYDMWGFSSPPTSPVAVDLYSITAAEYADRQANPRQQYYDTATGVLADYVAPVVEPTLAERAATALASARTYVSNNYTMLNEATPDTWVTYLKALMAIINGTDTTSTALPASPLDSTAYTLTGAATGTAGTAMTLSLAANNSGPATAAEVTLSDGSAGGKFSSPTVTLPAGSTAVQTVAYTPAAAGTVTISGTNTGGLTNPADLSVTVAAA